MKSQGLIRFTIAVALASMAYAGPGAGKGMTWSLAMSHDGNSYDIDDIGAVAWAQAVAESFGRINAVVHLDYNNNMAKVGSRGPDMITSVKGAIQHFKTKESITFDCLTQADAAVANFKAVAEKLDANNGLVYMCGGPMEMPWRCLNAAPVDKRKYIILISHGIWNDNFTGPNSTHTWASLGQLPGGAVLDHIGNQNPGLGSGSNWGELASMGPEYVWLKSRDMKSGDVSDCGMTFYALTGNQNATPADVIAQFKKNVPNTVSLFDKNAIQKGLINLVGGRNAIRIQVSDWAKASGYTVADLAGNKFKVDMKPANEGWIEISTQGLANGNYILSQQNYAGKTSQSKMFIVNN